MTDDGYPVSAQFLCNYRGKKTGVRCTEAPVKGTPYCHTHKGSPTGTAAWWRQRSARKLTGGAEKILEEMGIDVGTRTGILADPRSVDPGVLLIEEIERTAGVIRWLESKIAELDEETEFITDVAVTTTETGMGAQGNNVDTTKVEVRKQVTHWWTILERERAHLASVTVAALRAGVEERRVRLAERSVDALENAMNSALLELGLDPHNERVRAVVGASLMKALSAGEDVVEGERLMSGEERETVRAERPVPKVLEGSVDGPVVAKPVDF